MHLAALSAGGQAPRGRFNGRVHSVFREACNIRLDDGRLLALLAPHLGNVPHGVRLDLPAGFDFSRQIALGQAVGCRADVLRVAGGGLSVDLGTAQPWQGILPAPGVDLTSANMAAAWRAAWRRLRQDRRRNDRREVECATRAVGRQGVRLARAARVLRPDGVAGALDRLIGCGPGLTPAGDDLVVGFLAALWCTAGVDPARRAFLDGLCAAVAAAAAATGDISRAYLIHAAHGQFAEALIALARGIAEGAPPGAVEFATMAALRVGHTSGAAGTFGLLLGLAAWAPQSAPPGPARPSDVIAGPDPVKLRADNVKASPSAGSATGSAAPPCCWAWLRGLHNLPHGGPPPQAASLPGRGRAGPGQPRADNVKTCPIARWATGSAVPDGVGLVPAIQSSFGRIIVRARMPAPTLTGGGRREPFPCEASQMATFAGLARC
jgi:Protein of unknown function (DUF2877)